jgi:hypothetical protein
MSLAFGAPLLISLVGWALLLAIVVWSLSREPAAVRARCRPRPRRMDPRSARRLVVQRGVSALSFSSSGSSGSIAEVYHPRGMTDIGATRDLSRGAGRRSWPLATRPPAWN